MSIVEIEAARDRIRRDVHVTPTWTTRSLGRPMGVDLRVKAELLQLTGSFKVRGVLNALAQLPPHIRSRGVVSMSAGNHAAALAFGAATYGSRAVIVMPTSASTAKIAATRAYGGEVVLTARPLPEVLIEVQAARQLHIVHPFDDPAVIAGAGTVGLELTEQIDGADAMTQALDSGKPVMLSCPTSVADGLSAPHAGVHTLTHVQQLTDSIVRVSDAQIEDAVRRIVERTKLAVEPAAAAGLAVLLTDQVTLEPGSRVVLVLSGGNVDPAVFARIMAAGTSALTSDE